MEQMGSYVIRLCAGAFLVGIVTAMSGNKNAVKWVSGLVLLFLALSPIRKLETHFLWDMPGQIHAQAKTITSRAEEDALHQIRAGIIERTCTYILDEAESLGADIQVLSLALEDEGFLPVRVELGGNISPYDRMVLSGVIEKDLGIGKEGQIWKE